MLYLYLSALCAHWAFISLVNKKKIKIMIYTRPNFMYLSKSESTRMQV